MLQARAALARVASRSGGPAAVQRRALLFASQNNGAVADGLKVQTAVVRAAAHPMHWLTMCATSAQLNGQLLASPTPGDVRTTVDGVASVLLRHFSSQSGKGDSSVKGGADEVEASDSEPRKRQIPTHGQVSGASKTYFVVDPLKGHGDAFHPLVDCVRRGKWCTMVGPRRQGKSTTVVELAKARHKGTSVACVCYVNPDTCAKHGDGEDLLKALLLDTLTGDAHREKLSAMSVVEWLGERDDVGHKTFIFLDDFDVLASPAVKPATAGAFVDHLRMLHHHFSGTLMCAAVGSTRATRVRSLVTPFNIMHVMSAPPFSPAQVKELMQMAVDEEVLVPDDMDFADRIHTFCAGHRGMVCACAKQLQLARSKGEPWTIDRWDDFCKCMVNIAAGDVEAAQLAYHLADLDKTYPASDVSDVLATAVMGAQLYLRRVEPVVAATVTTLADDGFLVQQPYEVSFALTSPLYGGVLRRMVVDRALAGIPTVADVVHCHTDGELDVGSTLLRCLTKLTAAQLTRLALLTTAPSKYHPSEEAYCMAVGTLLSAASRKVPGFQVAHEVHADRQRVDMVLDKGDQRHLVEFVAHEPPGGFTDGAARAGSMAERYERVRSSYAVKLGVPLERCWLVCFDIWHNRSSSREAMWETLVELPAADRGTVDAPGINVMWVFHSYDFKQATYRIDLAGGRDNRVGGAADDAASQGAGEGASRGAGAGAASGTRAVSGKWTPFLFA